MILNGKIQVRCAAIVLFAVVSFLISCKSTRNVPPGETLLKKVIITSNNVAIDKSELEAYQKQKPNTRIFNLIPMRLYVYNLLKTGKERKWKKKIIDVFAEEPVLTDEFLIEKTRKQFALYLKNKGFFDAIVTVDTEVSNKKTTLNYIIETNKPYKISGIDYLFEDKKLAFIAQDTSGKSLIKVKSNYDVDILQNERQRITNLLKNSGYYNFSKVYIDFIVDSSEQAKNIRISLRIKKYQTKSDDNIVYSDHKKYYINKVNIFPDFEPLKAIQDQNQYFTSLKTENISGFYFVYSNKMEISPKVILQQNYINSGEIYQIANVEKTYKYLGDLQQFELINIQFSEKNDFKVIGNDTLYSLDCFIQLTPFLKKSYDIALEGKNTSGNIGFGGNIQYGNKNLFGGAEIFNLRLSGSLEVQSDIFGKKNESVLLPNTTEYSAEARLFVPKLFFPVSLANLFRNTNPKSTFTSLYMFQNRPDYTRTISNISFGYNWNSSLYKNHWLKLIELNAVGMKDITDEFRNSIQDPVLKNSYENQFILLSDYSYEFNNQDIKKFKDYKYFRINSELAGNMLSLIYSLTGKKNDDGYYELFNTRFAQYAKTDIEFRYNQIISRRTSLVYRCFGGIGIPYGNSDAIPFIKKYFSGGANSIRAWQVRSLGPGSYSDTTDIPNVSGDIKLEANIEYRFYMFWKMKAAFFVDAGNVWALNQKTDDRKGADFSISRFYKEIAVGTGFGTRLDFDYFLFRLDFGIKVHDPVFSGTKSLFPNYSLFSIKSYTINIGIGYPF